MHHNLRKEMLKLSKWLNIKFKNSLLNQTYWEKLGMEKVRIFKEKIKIVI